MAATRQTSIRRQRRWLYLAVAAIVVLAGCGTTTSDGEPFEVTDAVAVHCTLTHRDAVTEPIQDLEEVEVAPGETRTIGFDTVEVDLIYDVSPQEGATLRVDAREAGDDEPLVRHLYQFTDEGPPADFAGATGFTGLTYLHPPGTDAEVQFFCSADPPDAA